MSPRLRRADCSSPGLTRRKAGKGFTYLDADGERVTEPEDVERIAELGIPPAWKDVWICPDSRGHLQATGIDAAGRKQYLYHPQWRTRRDSEKFDEMLRFAARAAEAARARRRAPRARPTSSPATACWPARCGCSTAASSASAPSSTRPQNESYGLATMRKEHVTLDPEMRGMVFDYVAKSGKRRIQGVVDPAAFEVVAALKRRRGGGPELLAYKNGRSWADVRSPDINEYLKEATGDDFSAKDFRTWAATMLAAIGLAVSGEVAATQTGRKRAVARAVKEVSHYLGNTPAVCRASYIDPRVIDRYNGGLTSPACSRRSPTPTRSASCRSTSRWSSRPCSTCSTSARRRRLWSGWRPERRQQPAQRRPAGHAVHDDRDDHARDRRPHHDASPRRRRGSRR